MALKNIRKVAYEQFASATFKGTIKSVWLSVNKLWSQTASNGSRSLTPNECKPWQLMKILMVVKDHE